MEARQARLPHAVPDPRRRDRHRNERDVALWQEWEQGSHGMQQLVWSNGLKQRCGVTEVKDEEIAEEDGGGELAGSSRPGAGRRSTRSRRT
ncbi:hypothetical protein [Pseudonocardia sp. Ae717_Ps2]|uniref:hypothetical protein n=1 Tax=Pseudonocardia sp. Ae717_Ps2 TaxID=1885573 RepID=UPI00117A978C|nr:hypothetical protein [Pseudonocardia sp. Ae717_Ps2]